MKYFKHYVTFHRHFIILTLFEWGGVLTHGMCSVLFSYVIHRFIQFIWYFCLVIVFCIHKSSMDRSVMRRLYDSSSYFVCLLLFDLSVDRFSLYLVSYIDKSSMGRKNVVNRTSVFHLFSVTLSSILFSSLYIIRLMFVLFSPRFRLFSSSFRLVHSWRLNVKEECCKHIKATNCQWSMLLEPKEHTINNLER